MCVATILHIFTFISHVSHTLHTIAFGFCWCSSCFFSVCVHENLCHWLKNCIQRITHTTLVFNLNLNQWTTTINLLILSRVFPFFFCEFGNYVDFFRRYSFLLCSCFLIFLLRFSISLQIFSLRYFSFFAVFRCFWLVFLCHVFTLLKLLKSTTTREKKRTKIDENKPSQLLLMLIF